MRVRPGYIAGAHGRIHFQSIRGFAGVAAGGRRVGDVILNETGELCHPERSGAKSKDCLALTSRDARKQAGPSTPVGACAPTSAQDDTDSCTLCQLCFCSNAARPHPAPITF